MIALIPPCTGCVTCGTGSQWLGLWWRLRSAGFADIAARESPRQLRRSEMIPVPFDSLVPFNSLLCFTQAMSSDNSRCLQEAN